MGGRPGWILLYRIGSVRLRDMVSGRTHNTRYVAGHYDDYGSCGNGKGVAVNNIVKHACFNLIIPCCYNSVN